MSGLIGKANNLAILQYPHPKAILTFQKVRGRLPPPNQLCLRSHKGHLGRSGMTVEEDRRCRETISAGIGECQDITRGEWGKRVGFRQHVGGEAQAT
jgi:hypothetical protein